MSSSVVGGWNRGRFDNAVVVMRDFRARLSDSDNVVGGLEEVAVDCDWQVQACHDSTQRSGLDITRAFVAGENLALILVLHRESLWCEKGEVSCDGSRA